ncbi:MAG: hypothetical protein V9F06_00225 [Thermomicrobiales bacterium]
MLKGRLGLETARIPHGDRHGLLWLGRGNLVVDAGTLRFITAGDGDLPAGDYAIPFQTVSCIALQPGATVSHDALRLCARHSTGIVVTGVDGRAALRLDALRPRRVGPRADAGHPLERSQPPHPHRPADVCVAARGDPPRRRHRGAARHRGRAHEGASTSASREQLRDVHGAAGATTAAAPDSADLANQAINHASTAVYALAQVAVAVTGTIPQLGFIHEDSGRAFALDIADLFRDSRDAPGGLRGGEEPAPRRDPGAGRAHATPGAVFTRDTRRREDDRPHQGALRP